MSVATQKTVGWRLGVIAALAVGLTALYPQFAFWWIRGGEWRGAHVQTHGDEAVYAAYVGALIQSRPRRSDPYTGRDDSESEPQPESYFSVQFVPAYALATSARLFDLTTSQVFIALNCLAALASALAVFRLLASVTCDEQLAAAGVFIVLFLASSPLLLKQLLGLGSSNSFLPFLRRYQPSLTFPLLFVFCLLTWRALVGELRRAVVISSLLAGGVFALLLFSYFYLWTGALAWLFCLSLLWFAAFPEARKRLMLMLVLTGGVALAALAPYLILLSNVSAATGEKMNLAMSRAPDLFRVPELVGAALIAVLGVMAWRGLVEWREKKFIFAAAFALTPFVVFNQQVLTGRSLQPFHYELNVVNYLVMVGVMLAVGTLRASKKERARQVVTTRALALIALVALGSGAAEAELIRRRHLGANLVRDEARPATLRLAQLARSPEGNTLDTRSVVLATDPLIAAELPCIAPQPVLWAPHLFVFPAATLDEDRERLAQFLYYTGVDFAEAESKGFDALDKERQYYLSSLIGRGRHNERLVVNWTPITSEEIQGAMNFYSNYIATFDRARASQSALSYVLTSARENVNLSNLDRWYERDAGEHFGQGVTLYRVRLREP